MANKRVRLTERNILENVRLPILPGDIVTDNMYFPDSNLADHFKVLQVYELRVPYINSDKYEVEIWAGVECIHSPKTPAFVGTKMAHRVSGLRRVGGTLTLGEYLKRKGVWK